MSSLQSRVLLVDDEPSIRRALRTTLSALGFEIEEASGGEQAVSFVRTERYDAALLDINMPGMGGIEACRTIRRVCPRLPILMLTVRDSEDDKGRNGENASKCTSAHLFAPCVPFVPSSAVALGTPPKTPQSRGKARSHQYQTKLPRQPKPKCIIYAGASQQ